MKYQLTFTISIIMYEMEIILNYENQKLTRCNNNVYKLYYNIF